MLAFFVTVFVVIGLGAFVHTPLYSSAGDVSFGQTNIIHIEEQGTEMLVWLGPAHRGVPDFKDFTYDVTVEGRPIAIHEPKVLSGIPWPDDSVVNFKVAEFTASTPGDYSLTLRPNGFVPPGRMVLVSPPTQGEVVIPPPVGVTAFAIAGILILGYVLTRERPTIPR